MDLSVEVAGWNITMVLRFLMVFVRVVLCLRYNDIYLLFIIICVNVFVIVCWVAMSVAWGCFYLKPTVAGIVVGHAEGLVGCGADGSKKGS